MSGDAKLSKVNHKVKQNMKRRMKRSKYGATKVTVEGIQFDSRKEGERYLTLREKEKRGEISDLRIQVPYELLPAIYHDETIVKHLKTKDKVETKRVCDQKAVTYKADFVYKDALGTDVVEDVKGSKFTITKEFKLKEKMMFALLGIRIRIVL